MGRGDICTLACAATALLDPSGARAHGPDSNLPYIDDMRRQTGGMSARALRPTRTFVSLTGPAGNLGDALIRRATLDWMRGTSDQLVIYTGAAPDVWLRQLGVPANAVVLRSKRSVPRWLWLLATAPSRPVLAFEAGEIPLGRGNVLRELVFLAETVIVRLKRGVVVRPPRGIRGATKPAVWLHARAARLSQIALWRDATSAALVGGTGLAPDIGFAAGIRPGAAWHDRDELIVSLRGTRPHPGDEWIAAVRALATAEGLRIRTVVQVREDEARSRELADQLGGEYDPWGDTDPVAQEQLLRERYDGARLVISDRMHVLVLAALSGAAPAEAVPAPTAKISDAFEAVGLTGITLDTSTADPGAITAFLSTQLTRAAEVRARVADAAHRLADIEAGVRRVIRQART